MSDIHVLPAGTIAPNFSLKSQHDHIISLSDFQDKPVILAFYPADWSPVCGDQLTLYNEMLPMFEKYGAQLIGISVDGYWCHKAFAENRNLKFPILSDFEPKGEVSKLYGAYSLEQGESQRALYVIDANGLIQWSYLSPIAENPGADGILQALEEIKEEETFDESA